MCQLAGKHAHPLFEGALMAMDAAVDFAARISGATINNGTTLDVFYGGVLNNATVNSGGSLVIDGTVNGATAVRAMSSTRKLNSEKSAVPRNPSSDG